MTDIHQTIDQQSAAFVNAIADRLEFRAEAGRWTAGQKPTVGGGTPFFASCNYHSYLPGKPG